jgi:WD40 repeat protein
MGNDGKAKLFDYSNDGLRERMTLSGHSVTVGTGDFSPDGRYLATGSLDGTVRIWDITPGGSEELFVLAAMALEVEYSPDGRYLVTLGADGTAKIWDAQTGEPIVTLSGHTARVNDAAISPDGKTIATASEDTDVILWDAISGQQIRVISGHDEGPLMGNTFVGVTAVNFSPEGEKLATAGADGKVKVFDVNSGQELLSIIADPQRRYGVTQVTFTPDGGRLVTGTDAPAVVRIWDVNSGEELFSLPAVSGLIGGLALSPNGKRLAISESNGPLYMWSLDDEGNGSDITTGNIRLLFETKAHPTTARGLSFSPDGTLLATAGFEGTVKIWDAMTGQSLLTYEYANGITDTAISPDGKYLAASGIDGFVHVTLLNLDDLIELARTRVTRSLTNQECQQYLHLEACPAGN